MAKAKVPGRAPAAAPAAAPTGGGAKRASGSGHRGKTLTGRQKAAIFLVTLGSEVASEIFKHLREDEIEQLTFEIARLENIEASDRDAVLTEFQGADDGPGLHLDGRYRLRPRDPRALARVAEGRRHHQPPHELAAGQAVRLYPQDRPGAPSELYPAGASADERADPGLPGAAESLDDSWAVCRTRYSPT